MDGILETKKFVGFKLFILVYNLTLNSRQVKFQTPIPIVKFKLSPADI